MPIIESKTIYFPVKPQATVQQTQKRNLGKRVFIGLVKLVLYVAFVVTAIYYTPKILSRQLKTPYPLATIMSGSMWPELKINDLILMRGISGREAQIGQIIIYENAKGFTIHRLVRKENGKLITKGDANVVEDAPIDESQVIGRIVYWGDKPFKIPYLGTVARNLGPKLNNFSATGGSAFGGK